MSAPAASVIVALNPHDAELRDVLDAYGAQTPGTPRFELLVVDNGSRAAAAKACAEARSRHAALDVRHVPCPRRGRAAANNTGAAEARSDVLVFVADDFVPSPPLVRAHVEFHRCTSNDAVAIGPAYFVPALADDPFRHWLERSGRLFGVPFASAALAWSREFFYVGNASMKRTRFEALGGFDERFGHDLVDDLEFGYRLRDAGARTHLLTRAIAWHDHAVTLDERELAMRRAGAAARLVAQRWTGPLPWSGLVSLPLHELGERVAQARQATEAFFEARLDLAFAEGYAAAG